MELNLSIEAIFDDVERQQRADRQARLQEGIGILRGGNTGLYEEGEAPAVQCPRKTILRSFFGLEPPPDPAKDLIFENGLSSEGQVVHLLTEFAARNGLTMHTQSFKTAHHIGGVLVSGSPDIVFLKDDVPVKGMELKNMNSVYKALGVLHEECGVDAAAQAAHYSYALGKLPWSVMYSSYTQHHNLSSCYGAAAKAVPQAPRFEHLIAWGKDKAGDDVPKSLLGFRTGWDLHWLPDDQVGISFSGLRPGGGHPLNTARSEIFPTIITWARIKAFYELCNDPQGKTWPGRPSNPSLDGNKEKYKICDYCEWSGVCTKLGKKSCVAAMAEHILVARKRGEKV